MPNSPPSAARRTLVLSAAVSALLTTAPTAPHAAETSITTDAGVLKVEVIAEGLTHPWGMAFLPDGRMLVTERAGRLRIIDADNTLSEPLSGTPEVFAEGQGGLLDVALDPNFAENSLVYLSFAEPGSGGAGTALGRGRLEGDAIEDFEVIFRQEPKVSGANHFAGRIVFSPEGHIFLTLGDRFKFDPAQDLSDHLGTVVRINPDGSVPEDNPFVGDADARDEIWTYGHRNIEAGIWDEATGNVWIAEMGPRGGDELNRLEPGSNYGWPVVSWGEHYNGNDIPDPPTHPEFAASVMQWTPVISPSGMTPYDAELLSEWRDSVLIGSLTDQALVRVRLGEGGAEELERIPFQSRIRDVEVAPDGAVILLTDQPNGNVLRLSPLDS